MPLGESRSFLWRFWAWKECFYWYWNLAITGICADAKSNDGPRHGAGVCLEIEPNFITEFEAVARVCYQEDARIGGGNQDDARAGFCASTGTNAAKRTYTVIIAVVWSRLQRKNLSRKLKDSKIEGEFTMSFRANLFRSYN